MGGLVGATLAGGSALLMWGGGDRSRALLPEGFRPVSLTEKEAAVLFALVDRLIPDAPGALPVRDARIAERIDRELTFHPPQMTRDVKTALLLIEYGGLLHLSGTRFTHLSAEARDRRLEQMFDGLDVERQALVGLKVMATFFYYCDERTWTQIQYEGPLVSIPSPPEADSRVAPRPA